MRSGLKEHFAIWDDHIKAGRFDVVRAAIKNVPLKNIARSERLPMASICRRVQMYQSAIKALFPIIREGQVEPTMEEVAEYSASLLRSGSVREVRNLLSSAGDESIAEVALYRAFAEIVEWNYPVAITFLLKYLKFTHLSPYQRQVAEVNLAMSFIGSQRYDEALPLLQRLIAEAHQSKQLLIYGSCLCHLGDLYFKISEFALARQSLESAREILPASYHQYHLLTELFLAMLDAQTGSGPSHPAAFDDIKRKARGFGLSEILRGCDFAKAKWSGDQNSFYSSYIGSTMPAFRVRYQELPQDPPESAYVARTDIGEITCTRQKTAESPSLIEPPELVRGQALHRALIALHQDFYKPLSFGELFEALYPDTYYDPFTSYNRMHQIIGRLRQWIREQKLEWTIKIDQQRLVLLNSGNSPLLVPSERDHLLQDHLHLMLVKIHGFFGSAEFSMHSLLEKKFCTRSQAYRCLAQAVDNRFVEKSGHARYNMYRFVKSPAA